MVRLHPRIDALRHSFIRGRVESYALAVTLVALNAMDWSFTWLAISRGMEEANPLMAGWVSGPSGFLVKTIGVGVIGWVLYSRRSRVILRVMVGVYALVVAWNAVAVFLMR